MGVGVMEDYHLVFEPLGMGEKNLKKTAQISDFVPLYLVCFFRT
jgi:hypothetical protein